jgi:hypothetical protein
MGLVFQCSYISPLFIIFACDNPFKNVTYRIISTPLIKGPFRLAHHEEMKLIFFFVAFVVNKKYLLRDSF